MTYNKAINILKYTKYDTAENKAKKDMAIKFLDKQGFFRSDIEKLAIAICDFISKICNKFKKQECIVFQYDAKKESGNRFKKIGTSKVPKDLFKKTHFIDGKKV